MAKHIAFLSCVLLAAAGCQESITAPGACPDYCKDASFEVLDSVFTDVVVRDSSFGGFVFSHRSGGIQIVRQPAGVETRGMLGFIQFQPSVPTFPGDTQFGDVTAIDSFVVQFSIVKRPSGAQGVTIGLHRIPVDFDSSTTYGALDPFFEDSTFLGELAVPDTLENGDVTITLPPDAFQSLPGDTLQVSLGVEISSSQPTFLSLGTGATSALATLRRYFKVDSSGTIVTRDDTRIATFSSAVPNFVSTPGGDELAIGGIPSARAVLRISGVEDILSGSSVIRATLEFTPSGPIMAAPGDSVLLQVNPVGVDFGKKSPVVLTQLDTLSRGLVMLPGGSTEPFEIDVTTIVRAWALNADLPRTVILTARPEAATIGEVRIHSSRGAEPPRLRLTFVPPLGLSN